MLDDLKAVLDREAARAGLWGTLWAGLQALGDLKVRLVRERWVAARGYSWERHGHRENTAMNGERGMMMMRELRLAARALLRRPGFTAIGVLTLGLGIGATVAIFTLVNAIVLQPMPYEESDRIVEIMHHAPALDLPELNNSPGMLGFYEENATVFEAIVGTGRGGMNLTGSGRPERVQVFRASPNFFDVFRIRPSQGRAFVDSDISGDDPPRVVLLTDRGLTTLFGGARDVIGRTVQLDGSTAEVIGVLPASFRPQGNEETHFVAPLFIDPNGEFGEFGIRGFARLADGTSFAAAEAQIQALQARLPETFEDLTAEGLAQFGWGASLRTLKDSVIGDSRATLLIVLGTVSFVLLIACLNVANLFLVRAESRQKELAVRAAMGAGARRIAGTFLSESLVLGLAGGVVGVAIAYGGVSLLTSLGSQDLPRLHEVAVTPGVLSFAAVLSVVAGLFLGAIPAVRYGRLGSAGILRGNRTSTDGAARFRTRNLLVTTQLALALILLVGSGLMVRSLTAMNRLDLGFDAENTLVVGLSVGTGLTEEDAARFYQNATDEAAALPGVVSVGFGQSVPLISTNSSGGSINVEGEPEDDEAIPEVSLFRAVGPGYMESLGYRLVEGRAMERADWESQVPTVWINTHFRDAFLDGEGLGKRVNWNGNSEVFAEVVGVFEQTREFGVTDQNRGFALVPLVTTEWVDSDTDGGFLVVRGAPGTDVRSLTPALRAIVSRLNPNVPITTVQRMDEVVRSSMAGRAITMTMLSIAAAVALFLGMIGLFGVISYVVGQRTREIGIRMALGAEAGEVGAMVLRQGVGVIAAGVLVGLAGAFAVTRLLGSLLYEVSATDPLTFVAAPLVLVAVSLLATWVPARRASRIDPLSALRAE
jgi:predicted permease